MHISIILFLAILFILGLFICFFGAKYFRRLMSLFTFIIVGLFMYSLLLPMGTLTAAIVAFVVGALAGLLAYFVYVIGVFLAGALAGFAISMIISIALSMISGAWYTLTLVIILSLAGGICAVLWRRFFVILGTSTGGAYSMVTAALFAIFAMPELTTKFAEGISQDTLVAFFDYADNTVIAANANVFIVAFLVLALAGLIVQFKKTAPKKLGKK